MFRSVNTIKFVPSLNMQLFKPPFKKLSNVGDKTILNLGETLGYKTVLRKLEIRRRQFHISSYRRTLDPIDLDVIRCVATVSGILFGRFVRWQWKKLPQGKKSAYISMLKYIKYIILVSGTFLLSQLWFYYNNHLQLNKVTGKNKFILYTKDQIQDLSENTLTRELKSRKKGTLQPLGPNDHRTKKVFYQLITKNTDIEEVKNVNWDISVLDIPYLPPAFLLPIGHVFVMSSLVDLCENDDQLSIIISHEVAHEILDHLAEEKSTEIFFDMLHVFLLIFIWTFMPIFSASIMHYASRKFMKLLFDLPLNRSQELEADKIGLFLSAKACYDVREAIPLWMNLQKRFKIQDDWNSTHPSAEQRIAMFKAILNHGIQLREDSNCPNLPPDDSNDADEELD